MSSERRVLGVDLGREGGAVLLDGDGIVFQARMPMLGKRADDLDVSGIRSLLTDHRPSLAVVERARILSPGKQAIAGLFYHQGAWVGVLAGLGIPCQMVDAKDWQAWALQGERRKTYKERKEAAVRVAKRRFPEIELPTQVDWGQADAALIAAFGASRLQAV